MTPLTSSSRLLLRMAAGIIATAFAAEGLLAQQRLLGIRSTQVSPIHESWTFGDGVVQRVNEDSVLVKRVTQWSIPVMVAIPLGSRLTFDASAAYAMGQVVLDGVDPGTGSDRYELAGPTDVKVRLVGRVVGDNVLVTLGANAPTGTVSLGQEELSALRVLAAPVLRLQTPGLGRGAGGTAGVVLARQLGGWAWALGLSYELTGSYAPIAAFTSGAPSPDLDPGDALHVSLGADGLVGEHGMTIALAVDSYTPDDLRFPEVGGGGTRSEIHLGPTFSAEWQLRIAAPRLRELTLQLADRYRTEYKQEGSTVVGSSGNQIEGGLRIVIPAGRSMGILVALDGRHHTGLEVDESLATAAMAGGGATLGLEIGGGAFVMQPFVRGQFARIDAGGSKTDARGIAGGVTLTMRY